MVSSLIARRRIWVSSSYAICAICAIFFPTVVADDVGALSCAKERLTFRNEKEGCVASRDLVIVALFEFCAELLRKRGAGGEPPCVLFPSFFRYLPRINMVGFGGLVSPPKAVPVGMIETGHYFEVGKETGDERKTLH